jgi:hypothetical protein
MEGRCYGCFYYQARTEQNQANAASVLFENLEGRNTKNNILYTVTAK